jgi:hypothetical protein
MIRPFPRSNLPAAKALIFLACLRFWRRTWALFSARIWLRPSSENWPPSHRANLGKKGNEPIGDGYPGRRSCLARSLRSTRFRSLRDANPGAPTFGNFVTFLFKDRTRSGTPEPPHQVHKANEAGRDIAAFFCLLFFCPNTDSRVFGLSRLCCSTPQFHAPRGLN